MSRRVQCVRAFPALPMSDANPTAHRCTLPRHRVRRLKYMSNKELSKTPKQIRAACILHNFVQLAEDERWDAPPLGRRQTADGTDNELAPAALDEGGEMAIRRLAAMVPDPDVGEDTLEAGRAVRKQVAIECHAERMGRAATQRSALTMTGPGGQPESGSLSVPRKSGTATKLTLLTRGC